ncbi:MAG: sensor histidine kinase KdpD [Actinomycetales bacterium]|nr:sensor histidine kinase KdpD [Actinomycetales bacterium]
MSSGRLRVMLGAAPGVGKTFAMLEEGRRLRELGRDVVVGVVETHGRAATAALLDGLEVVPRRAEVHRGVRLEEMDVDALLARAPDLALVDELAHTNAPGSRHEKRWEDVDELLAAGIDVITTVNVQHIASLNDVVTRITGVPQRETIPDHVLRRADRIELVDLAPEALRDRLGEGLVYPPERVDAALSNYFRLGNLTALRELALSWLADEVDSALRAYRHEHGIRATWEARERVVVALTGGPEGDTLLRRAARIAARAGGGELFAVHVTSPDGLSQGDPGVLAAQRALVESLGGSFHQVVSDRIPTALIEFARGVEATQLVIGVSRRGRIEALLGGTGIGQSVIRLSGDIDVHIVSHAEAGRSRLPKLGGALSLRRRVLGLALTAVGLPLLTWPLATFRSDESLAADVLAYQLLVVVVALVGGILPAVISAVGAGLLLDFFFTNPLGEVVIAEPLHLVAILIFVVVALLVSIVVDQAARRAVAAARSGAEAEIVAAIAGGVLRGEDALGTLVGRLREAFGLSSVQLREGDAVLQSSDGEGSSGQVESVVPVGEGATLVMRGRALDPSDRRILGVFTAQLAGALERRRLAAEAETMRPVAAADRLRSALLAAVGHDVRRPLAAARAAVSALRATDVPLDAVDRNELLATADESLASLGSLFTDLLDVTRIEAGALGIALRPVNLDAVVVGALDELGLGPGRVDLRLATVPPVLADGPLLQRAVVNLLANALRFSPSDRPPVITTSELARRVQLRIIDAGPGIAPERRDDVFVPFQRIGDTDNSSGLGLGLALSKGFIEGMGGELTAEDTPGGGLTMVIELPVIEEGESSA